jgi:NADPH:quinone reductase-like Zn-dependent oxidoreductase
VHCLLCSPATALLMLESIVDLQPGDVVVQNGATSAVGQVCCHFGCCKSLHIVLLVVNMATFTIAPTSRMLYKHP